MGLLIWKIIGYGVLFVVVGGIAISFLSAIGRILLYIAYPVFIVGSLIISILSYPLTAFIQFLGYQCPTLFPLWLKIFDNKPKYESSNNNRKNNNSKVNEPSEDASRTTPFDPWAILEIPCNSSKQEISAAYKKKLILNHPDKVASLDPELQSFATQRTILLRKAYEQLVGV